MTEHIPSYLERIDEFRWRIPRETKHGMRVDGIVYADERLMLNIREDKSLEQVVNVAFLPGIEQYSLAMPDIHWGYGFCIGGVAATNPQAGGVVSPGGVGYDINCGVRLIRTAIPFKDAKPLLNLLVEQLFSSIPCGVGQSGQVSFSRREMEQVLEQGSSYVLKKGFGWNSDLYATEAHGKLEGADAEAVSSRAYERGAGQCGTLGSGNHFAEIQVVEDIYDEEAARIFGLEQKNLAVMIHSGSRGLGYQVCEDALRELAKAPQKYGIALPDRQLVSAPIESPEGQRYLGAMRAAANFAWANRQMMTHLTREAFEAVFTQPAEALGMHLVYDVAHNIAKEETHRVNGKEIRLLVHRKGATRAFPPGHAEVPQHYRSVGQPVLVPGDMGRCSYVLAGQERAMAETFGSCCHGAGRRLSRKAALKAAKGRSVLDELRQRGVIARARSVRGLEEEQPDAYKDVREVVHVVHNAGLAKLVAKLRPVGVIKG